MASVTPDGSKVYVANSGDNTVSVIDTASSIVVAVLPVGNGPTAFGVFIQPRFAGTPGDANCLGKSISALAQTFGGLNAASIALGSPRRRDCRLPLTRFAGHNRVSGARRGAAGAAGPYLYADIPLPDLALSRTTEIESDS
jgi:YVTN family beta-propeller protein